MITLAGVRPATDLSGEPSAQEIMWAHYVREQQRGRTPSGAELDRVAGTNNYGRTVPRLLTRDQPWAGGVLAVLYLAAAVLNGWLAIAVITWWPALLVIGALSMATVCALRALHARTNRTVGPVMLSQPPSHDATPS